MQMYFGIFGKREIARCTKSFRRPESKLVGSRFLYVSISWANLYSQGEFKEGVLND